MLAHTNIQRIFIVFKGVFSQIIQPMTTIHTHTLSLWELSRWSCRFDSRARTDYRNDDRVALYAHGSPFWLCTTRTPATTAVRVVTDPDDRASIRAELITDRLRSAHECADN